jgi:hypothetical protein
LYGGAFAIGVIAVTTVLFYVMLTREGIVK